MKIIIVKDADEAGRTAADLFEKTIAAKPDCLIGLATGSTPLPLYRELIARERAGRIDFSRVKTVNLDEYAGLSPDHPLSYRRFMQENLFDRISVKPENTFLPDGVCADAEKMCIAYEENIRKLGGVDLQLLGIGHDGHIGFNEPDTVFPKMTHKTALSDMTIDANRRFFASREEVPRYAYTMGIGTVMAAKKIVMIVTGKDKAAILKKAVEGDVTPAVPASVLQFHGDVTVVCDAAAASELSK